ncbi:MAG: radical SAM protein [Leptolyngbyaceae cyanobacterium CSU_1_3]|nr:radical SAM protein [Leptolyngbyaceae cyanobacterium CSU_1_3]
MSCDRANPLPKILLVGEVLRYRSFNGANKALPVLASSLYQAGFTQVVQMDLERSDLTIQNVLQEAIDADLIIFAGCMTPQWAEIDRDTKAVFDQLQKIGRSQVPILVGGYATKGVADIATITPWIAAYCDGEGETMIIEVARAVAKGTFWQEMQQIQGLAFVDEAGEFRHSIASRVGSFDHIDQNFGLVHVPEVHDMDIFRQHDRVLKTAQLFTQRGCPWQCGFCNKSTESSNVFRINEASFRQQLQQLRQRGYQAVYLDVDTFTVHEQAARREAQILKQEGFVWGSNTRIDQIDFEQMVYLVEHNCVYLFFGVEHLMVEVSLAIGKFNGSLKSQLKQALDYPKKVEQVFREMGRAGLPSSYFVILGLPKAKISDNLATIVGYEPTTFEDDMSAIRFGLERCDPDFLNFNTLRFMPGSAAADLPSSAYTCVRPSGSQPITAGYFLPRAAKHYRYHTPQNHGVYRLCESVDKNQPTSIAMNATRLYETIHDTMQMINAKVNAGGKATTLFIDRDLLAQGLVNRDQKGRYTIAPLTAFAQLS